MKVGVTHQVKNPQGLQERFARAREEGVTFPEGISCPIRAFATDLSIGFCIWEGPSVAAVKEVVEALVGEYTQNEYFEAQVVGLPT